MRSKCVCVCFKGVVNTRIFLYGVATITRLLKIIGLFGRISYGSCAKETCNFKEPTNRSHPIYSFGIYVRYITQHSSLVMYMFTYAYM